MLKKIVTIFILLLSIIVTITTAISPGLKGFLYFTNQSNFLVLIIMILVLMGKENEKFYEKFSFVTLVSILMTGIIFNLLLRGEGINEGENLPFMYKSGLQNLLTHTVIPILYLGYYFIFNDSKISIKKFYVGLIHPLVYLLYFLITGPFTNFYPYFFIDVSKIGFFEVFRWSFLIIMPVLIIFSLVLISLKKLYKKEV